MEDDCDCDECRLARLGIDPAEADAVRRGGDAIARYMRLYNCGFPEAIEGLQQERRRLTAFALAAIAQRHGLDDAQARLHLARHRAEPPEVLQ